MKILVVDDEKTIVKGIKFNLENEGYQVDVCYDGETAVDMARRGEYAVILLDLMMPKLDGLGACQQIRQFSTVPIIMLTARSEDADKLIGFESGADDYITKPFNILELKARIRALIRRSSMAPAAPAEPDGGKLVRGHIEIDPERRSARRFGQNVELTLKEFDLIELLMRNPGKVYSREQLLDHDAIRDAMSGMHYVGVTGDMTLDETGTPEKSVAILTFTPSDGKLVQKFVKTQS